MIGRMRMRMRMMIMMMMMQQSECGFSHEMGPGEEREELIFSL